MLEKISFMFNWFIENKEELLAFLVSLGVLVEAINAIFPTKNKDSFLEKTGRFITFFTSKLPSVQTKNSSSSELSQSSEELAKKKDEGIK